MTDRYTVFGNPVAHSKSPQIHALFAAQEGARIEYGRILADTAPAAFAQAVETFFAEGGRGANVTLPFKQAAFELADQTSARAQAAGAANTLIPLENGRIFADNTDGAGLVRDLTDQLAQLGQSIADKTVLIIGAGGAARGVILPLLECAPASITVCNRTAATACELAERFAIQAKPFTELNPSYDLIINATSVSLNGEVPPVPSALFSGCLLAYDMVYAETDTAFMRFAAAHGARHTCDGLGMLVGQAAESYRLWRGFTPDTAAVIAALRGKGGA